eukprot:SAG11_NODE_130_length_15497_cov_10.780556_5_plen_117_part_00
MWNRSTQDGSDNKNHGVPDPRYGFYWNRSSVSRKTSIAISAESADAYSLALVFCQLETASYQLAEPSLATAAAARLAKRMLTASTPTIAAAPNSAMPTQTTDYRRRVPPVHVVLRL